MGIPWECRTVYRLKTMEIIGDPNKVSAIKALDKPSAHGAKVFEIVFEKPVDPAISEKGTFGVENLEWTPEVLFCRQRNP